MRPIRGRKQFSNLNGAGRVSVIFPNSYLDFRLTKAGTQKCDLWDWPLCHRGDSLCPQDTSTDPYHYNLPSSSPLGPGPSAQDTNLALSQVM